MNPPDQSELAEANDRARERACVAAVLTDAVSLAACTRTVAEVDAAVTAGWNLTRVSTEASPPCPDGLEMVARLVAELLLSRATGSELRRAVAAGWIRSGVDTKTKLLACMPGENARVGISTSGIAKRFFESGLWVPPADAKRMLEELAAEGLARFVWAEGEWQTYKAWVAVTQKAAA